MPLPTAERARATAGDPRARQGFEILLTKSLRATARDNVLVIYDESLVPFLPDLTRAVVALGLWCGYVCIPEAYQVHLTSRLSRMPDHADVILPLVVRAAISEASVIVNALSGRLETLPVRKAIIRQERRNDCRLAHIPGISRPLLTALAGLNVDQVTADCELMAWALGEAQHAELTTCDTRSTAYTLHLELDGWANEPLLSLGIIPPNSWGNVPPGEAFCCPRTESVEGRVCINGSVPGHRLAARDEVVLDFEAGRLRRWTAAPGGHAGPFLAGLRRNARRDGDSNWNCLAELGIGLNPAVKTLTGNSLLDEKAAGTIHVALGENFGFGHDIQSLIHADLVARGPSLHLDGHLVVDRGTFRRADVEAWRQSVAPLAIEMDGEDSIQLVPAKFVMTEDGRVARRLASGSRCGTIEIVQASRGADLSRLIQLLPRERPLAVHLARARIARECPDLLGRLGDLLAIGAHYGIFILRRAD